MTERNEGRESRSNDWSTDPNSPPPDAQNSVRGDVPQPVPPHEPEDWQAPDPQGPRESQGGEWDAGHTVEEEAGGRKSTWQEGMGEEEIYHPESSSIERTDSRHTGRPKMENSDIFAIILSAFFPGVGQMMLGQQTKGIVVLMVAIFTGCGLGLLSLASALDTYCVAMAKKRREVDEWEFFPDIREWF